MILGLLIGYERWGTTAALVTIVKKELAKMAQVEAKLGIVPVGRNQGSRKSIANSITQVAA